MSIYEVKTMGERIAGNSYVGRGVVLGLSGDGENAVCAYFIMGRSENSRNRIFTEKNGDIYTEPFDASKVEDPSLIIYAAVRDASSKLIVTNGDQTDTIYEYLRAGNTFEEALESRKFEPDAPNFTPRISGMMTFGEKLTYKLSILKSLDEQGSECSRYFFNYAAKKGLGHFIHTYNCDGNPIPTFTGEPERIKVPNDIDEFTKDIWDNLDDNNKISLYVRYTNLSDGSTVTRIINKNCQ